MLSSLLSILQISIKVLSPKFFFLLIIFKPCFTKALFRPVNGTTSQIVPNETKSRKFSKLGSCILFLSNHFFCLKFEFNETRNIKHTPAAHK